MAVAEALRDELDTRRALLRQLEAEASRQEEEVLAEKARVEEFEQLQDFQASELKAHGAQIDARQREIFEEHEKLMKAQEDIRLRTEKLDEERKAIDAEKQRQKAAAEAASLEAERNAKEAKNAEAARLEERKAKEHQKRQLQRLHVWRRRRKLKQHVC